MKSFKYTINGNVYKVHINSVVEDVAEVEVNGTPYHVKMEKPAKKQVVSKRRARRDPSGSPDGARRRPHTAAGSHPANQMQGRRYGETRTNVSCPRGHENGKQHQCRPRWENY